ncbi:MAG: putative histidine kinase, classic [Rhizobacter sp.]|nr:putative histidine kinase, classic [Rhizobacter sp.]
MPDMTVSNVSFFDTPAASQWMRFLAATPDTVVFLATPEGIIQQWLGASERVTGYTALEAIGQPISIFFPPEDLAKGLDAHELALVHSQGVAECDRWNLRKDGSRFWASGVLTAIRGDDQSVVALCKVMRDKTDVRYQIHNLENKLAAREADLARHRNVATSTAHELRNPLMPMSSAITLLKRPDAARFVDKAMTILENQMSVLKTLIDDLARTAHDPQSAHALMLDRVNLSEAVRAVVDGAMDSAARRGLELSVVLPASDLWIVADAARLQQMLLNLLGNALKYTPRGGRIGMSASVEANMALVRVEDDGVGIAPEVLPHIFELFTREDRQDEIEGLGVGLAIVKEMADLHGGQIEARSPGPGKGSVFGLRLPLARA